MNVKPHNKMSNIIDDYFDKDELEPLDTFVFLAQRRKILVDYVSLLELRLAVIKKFIEITETLKKNETTD